MKKILKLISIFILYQVNNSSIAQNLAALPGDCKMIELKLSQEDVEENYSFFYNKKGHVQSVKSSDNIEIDYIYNQQNKIIEIKKHSDLDKKSKFIIINYEDGNIKETKQYETRKQTNVHIESIQHRYDPEGRLVLQSFYNAEYDNLEKTKEYHFDYDNNNNVEKVTAKLFVNGYLEAKTIVNYTYGNEKNIGIVDPIVFYDPFYYCHLSVNSPSKIKVSSVNAKGKVMNEFELNLTYQKSKNDLLTSIDFGNGNKWNLKYQCKKN